MKRVLFGLLLGALLLSLIPIGLGCGKPAGGNVDAAAPMCTGEGCPIPGADGKLVAPPKQTSNATFTPIDAVDPSPDKTPGH